MPSPVTVRINSTEFDRAIKQYGGLTKRTPAEVCNGKSYFINRRAIWHTHKANADKIKQQLGAHDVSILKKSKRGDRFLRSKRKSFVFDSVSEEALPRLAYIIISRLRKAGKLTSLKMEDLHAKMVKVLNARLRSVAFIKSGFIKPRDTFKAWCVAHGVSIGGKGLPPNEPSRIGGPKQIGQPKGGAAPARADWIARATFYNSADAKHDDKASLQKYAGPALERAFTEETADTMAYVEKRLKQHAQNCGIRTR